MAAPAPAAPRRGTFAVYGGFFLVGVVSVMLGPLIPELRPVWGVSNAQAAWLFFAQFAASAIGSALSSFRLRGSQIGGHALVAAGLVGLAASGWPGAIAAMALIGFGLGLLIPSTNLLVAHRDPERRGAVLATLNMVWGLGAVASPLLFAALLGRLPATWALWALAGAAGLFSLVSTRTVDPIAGRVAPAARDRRGTSGFLFLVAGMLFLYVGAENAIGGWLVALADEAALQRDAVSMLIGSGFWGALLAGRAAAPLILRRVSEPALYRAALGLGLVGTLVILVAGSRPMIAAGALLAGLGLAPIFPLTVSIVAQRTAASGSRTTGWVFAFGGLGGAVLPWLTGRLSGDAGALARGFWVPLVGLALLAALFAFQRRHGADPPDEGRT